jgi:hypothetical protein
VSIERDKVAVVAGLTLPQNNGLVEGKVNKLKLIKRMMYGRAAFPLLRQRVLHALSNDRRFESGSLQNYWDVDPYSMTCTRE